MPLLTKQLKLLNISLQYDTLTIYPKTEYVSGAQMNAFAVECRNLGFLSPTQINSKATNYALSLKTNPDYDRYIHMYDDDHALYHKDTDKSDDNHMHLKFKSMLDSVKLKSILDMAVKFCVISSDEVAEVLADFNKKYEKDIQELANELTESKDQAKASKAIHTHIKQCDDLEALSCLHKTLLAPKFDFLRKYEESKNALYAPFLFKAIVSESGKEGMSSKAWADIEESFELQMIHILSQTCLLSSAVGSERAHQLHKDNPFFGMNHCIAAGPKAFETLINAIYSDESQAVSLLREGNVKKIEQEYEKHFKSRMK